MSQPKHISTRPELLKGAVLLAIWAASLSGCARSCSTTTPVVSQGDSSITKDSEKSHRAPASEGTAVAATQQNTVAAPLQAQSAAQMSPKAELKQELTQAPVEPKCHQFTFTHKASAQHDSDESCSHHKNVITLKHANVNPKSICVRVDGTPVAFTQVKGKNELLLGAVAGPESKIQVKYCVGKSECKESCKIPRDEFMDAIGAEADTLTAAEKAARWDADSKDDDGQDDPEHLISDEAKRETASAVFSDWQTDTGVVACESNS